jgi:hypothetical protein
MLWICLLVVFLGPVIGCLLFVFLFADAATVLTAAAGAIVGMIVSLAVVFSLN